MPYSQAERQMRVETPLGADVLLLQSFTGREGVSFPFSFQLEMLSENTCLDLASLLRQPVKIFIRTPDDSERCIHGLVSRAVQLGMSGGLVSYHAEVVPWLWFLSLDSDCKIFQGKTVPQILEAVFKERGFTDYRLQLMGSFPKRDYCVQYRESDLNFVSRLMEDEGIYYFFEHSQEKHTLVLANTPSAVQPCPQQDSAPCIGLAHGVGEQDVVHSLEQELRVHTGKTSLTDYNFETPSTSLAATVNGKQKNEIYDYPGKYLVKADGDRYTELRLQEQEVNHVKVYGTSSCRAFRPGYRVDVTDHYRDDANQTYMLLSVEHDGNTGHYQTNDGEGFSYQNVFTAIPYSVPFRPARLTRKPVVHGSQTAVVVGKSGEEIWVDKYGRVKVQFFWDRVGKKDENSSCWTRVSQIWAGKNWGSIHIPRIGQEVIVDFLEGDPDQPIITGRVYNAEQMPPYALPANQTQSGIKSRSTKAGGTANFNEFRFEDKKGEEQIYLHAEKDLKTIVENDETRDVGHDRTTTIERHEIQEIKTGNETLTIKQGSQTETIQQDQTLTIKQGNQTITLDMGNQSTTIKMGNQSTTIKMGNQTTKLNLGKSTKEALQSIELKVGQSSIKLDQMGVTIKGMTIKIEGQIQVQVKGLMTQVDGTAMLIAKGGITMIN